MKQENIKKALQAAKAGSKKRKFEQSIDIVITLKNYDVKKGANQFDSYVSLPYPRGKKASVCAFVGAELSDQAKTACDQSISEDEFASYNDPKKLRALARKHDFFIAQANLMPKVATTFGKFLGSRGKMPNPKAGCVVPPNANLTQVVERLQKLVRVLVKTTPVIYMRVGMENQNEEEVVANILTIYQNVLTHLDQYLVEAEARLQANGARVHWAENAAEANDILGRLVPAAQGE